jgi:hypothetical protein
MGYRANVLTLGVIDLVLPRKGGVPMNQVVARRRVGHYVGLSADLLEARRFEVFPRNVSDPDGGDASLTLD